MPNKQYELIRVTKTGSETLKNSFAYCKDILTHHGIEGHGVRLEDVPEKRTPIVSLRDPVERFRSAYDMMYGHDRDDFRKIWPTIENFAFWVDRMMYQKRFGYTLLPQSWWVRDFQYIKDREALWVLTPDIDTFIMQLPVEGKIVIPAKNRTEKKSEITTEVRHRIEAAYACDYSMLSDLGVYF